MPVAGALLALSFPNELPLGPWRDHPPAVLAWLALAGVQWALLYLSARETHWAIWLFAFVFSLINVLWVRLFGEGLMGGVLCLALAGYLSVTPLLALLLARCMRLPSWLLPVGFACAWTGLEWLRGQGVFGLAWAEVGASQIDGVTAHLAALGGVPLITFLVVSVSGVVVQWLAGRPAPRWLVPVVLAFLAVCVGGGWWQSRQAVARQRHQPSGQIIAVIQPSTQRGVTPAALVSPKTTEEFLARERRRIVREQTLLALSSAAMRPDGLPTAPAGTSRLIVWSESAISTQPDYPTVNVDLADLCRRRDSYVVVGAPHCFALTPPYLRPLRNAAYLFTPAGELQARYDKIHLVPFGEFVPFRRVVNALHYTVRDDDITPGTTRELLTVSGHRIGIGICFESTFSEIARAYARQGAHLLVYITNDAWFHRTAAVRQHLNHARFRALETGLPVARTASTGISGFIAPDGQVLSELPTYASDTLTRYVPDGAPGTIFTRGGWLFGPACLLAALVLAMLGAYRGWRSSQNGTSH